MLFIPFLGSTWYVIRILYFHVILAIVNLLIQTSVTMTTKIHFPSLITLKASCTKSLLPQLEYYPTSLRCSGVGYLAGMGQLGNGVGTLISKYTLDYELNVNGR